MTQLMAKFSNDIAAFGGSTELNAAVSGVCASNYNY